MAKRSGKLPCAKDLACCIPSTANLETAQKALALNFYIGITGPVTYKNAEEKREIVQPTAP